MIRVHCRQCGSTYFATLPDAIHRFCTVCEAHAPSEAGKAAKPNEIDRKSRKRKKVK